MNCLPINHFCQMNFSTISRAECRVYYYCGVQRRPVRFLGACQHYLFIVPWASTARWRAAAARSVWIWRTWTLASCWWNMPFGDLLWSVPPRLRRSWSRWEIPQVIHVMFSCILVQRDDSMARRVPEYFIETHRATGPTTQIVKVHTY